MEETDSEDQERRGMEELDGCPVFDDRRQNDHVYILTVPS